MLHEAPQYGYFERVSIFSCTPSDSTTFLKNGRTFSIKIDQSKIEDYIRELNKVFLHTGFTSFVKTKIFKGIRIEYLIVKGSSNSFSGFNGSNDEQIYEFVPEISYIKTEGCGIFETDIYAIDISSLTSNLKKFRELLPNSPVY